MMRTLNLAVAVSLALAANAASAGTATANLSVSATVLAVCVVATTPVAFGVYNPSSASPTDATGAVTVICTPGALYSIALDAGANPSTPGNVTTRRMKANTSDYLPYQLYIDAGRTTVWGDGANGSSLNPTSGTYTATGLLQSYAVYGRITTGNYVPSGSYVDTVVATVTYN
jgi:spore coat protein U-like protein